MSEMTNKKWMTDRRPEKEGTYWVTLEWQAGDIDITGEFIPKGTPTREVGTRFFSSPCEPGEVDSWAMHGESSQDYHWTEQSGSAYGEKVVAWMPYEEPEPYMGGRG